MHRYRSTWQKCHEKHFLAFYTSADVTPDGHMTEEEEEVKYLLQVIKDKK